MWAKLREIDESVTNEQTVVVSFSRVSQDRRVLKSLETLEGPILLIGFGPKPLGFEDNYVDLLSFENTQAHLSRPIFSAIFLLAGPAFFFPILLVLSSFEELSRVTINP